MLRLAAEPLEEEKSTSITRKKSAEGIVSGHQTGEGLNSEIASRKHLQWI
jgi:hypothetical protein